MALRVHRTTRHSGLRINHRPTERVIATNANPVRLRTGLLGRNTLGDLSHVSDRRRFNFDVAYPTLNVWGSRNRFTIPTFVQSQRPTGRERFNARSPFRTLSHRVVISRPDNVLVCIRRNRRREVIHAKGIAGSRVRKPKANAFTKFKCR